MRIVKAEDYYSMSRMAANIISAQIIMKPKCVIGLATGSTPLGTYAQLIEWYKKGDLDFREVTTINLDEYKGLSPENDQSYRYFMNQNLFDHINIKKENTYVQLLGLGNNGHIGFNEPDEAFEKETHCVKLSESTVNANSRFFENIDDVPKEAYTMGIKSIMQAKKIVVVVNGKNKAEIVKKAFFGPVTPNVPASVLQLHNDVTLVGDAEALELIDEYI